MLSGPPSLSATTEPRRPLLRRATVTNRFDAKIGRKHHAASRTEAHLKRVVALYGKMVRVGIGAEGNDYRWLFALFLSLGPDQSSRPEWRKPSIQLFCQLEIRPLSIWRFGVPRSDNHERGSSGRLLLWGDPPLMLSGGGQCDPAPVGNETRGPGQQMGMKLREFGSDGQRSIRRI